MRTGAQEVCGSKRRGFKANNVVAAASVTLLRKAAFGFCNCSLAASLPTSLPARCWWRWRCFSNLLARRRCDCAEMGPKWFSFRLAQIIPLRIHKRSSRAMRTTTSGYFVCFLCLVWRHRWDFVRAVKTLCSVFIKCFLLLLPYFTYLLKLSITTGAFVFA